MSWEKEWRGSALDLHSVFVVYGLLLLSSYIVPLFLVIHGNAVYNRLANRRYIDADSIRRWYSRSK